MIPASIEANISPPGPKCAETGASSTTKAAVGPETFMREPPSSGISAPATIEVYRPYCGGTPLAIASAMASVSATMPTTMPARMSARRSRAL